MHCYLGASCGSFNLWSIQGWFWVWRWRDPYLRHCEPSSSGNAWNQERKIAAWFDRPKLLVLRNYGLRLMPPLGYLGTWYLYAQFNAHRVLKLHKWLSLCFINAYHYKCIPSILEELNKSDCSKGPSALIQSSTLWRLSRPIPAHATSPATHYKHGWSTHLAGLVNSVSASCWSRLREVLRFLVENLGASYTLYPLNQGAFQSQVKARSEEKEEALNFSYFS